MKFERNTNILLICLVAFSGFVSLGSAKAEDTSTADGIKIRCACYRRVGDKQQIYVSSANQPEKRVETILPLYTFSKPFRVKGRSLSIYSGPAPKEGEGGDKPLATVKLPAQGKNFLLFFIPSRTGGELGYHVQVVPGDILKFKGGDQFFINLTKSDIQGKFGGRIFKLPARRSLLHKTSNKAGKEGKPSPILLYQKVIDTSKAAQWKLFCSSRWRIDKRIRTIVIIFNDPKRNKLSYRGITERVDLATSKL
jgi:hypothetical protein